MIIDDYFNNRYADVQLALTRLWAEHEAVQQRIARAEAAPCQACEHHDEQLDNLVDQVRQLSNNWNLSELEAEQLDGILKARGYQPRHVSSGDPARNRDA